MLEKFFVTASGKMRDINAYAFTSLAFHPKAECCLIDLAGLLARSLLSTFPFQYYGQWCEDSTVVSRLPMAIGTSVVSFSHNSRFTIHAKNLQLRG